MASNLSHKRTQRKICTGPPTSCFYDNRLEVYTMRVQTTRLHVVRSAPFVSDYIYSMPLSRCTSGLTKVGSLWRRKNCVFQYIVLQRLA